MNIGKTEKALAEITDEGFFERLATAILREDNIIYRPLIHPGVNINGKTKKSPLDAICFEKSADPPHMITVHHTITALKDLERKWLHDPSKVKPRKGTPTAPAGDLIKTGELVARERVTNPNLRATLVLTTNQEPSVDLISAVEAAGRNHGMEIDIWSRSRLSHFLDNNPSGQWLRHSFLGIDQELLSPELFSDLCKKSLDAYKPQDNPDAWVNRELDITLNASFEREITFLMAGSGMGKSVACYRKLKAHVDGGGLSIILSSEIVASALTLEQAVVAAVSQLHPSLLIAGNTSILSFFSPEKPLFLVAEDVNRSGRAHFLLEKIIGWSRVSDKKDNKLPSSWRLVCPIWPEVLSSLGEQTRKRIDPLIIRTDRFNEKEGRDAVLARARLHGRQLSLMSAESISSALGYDPLLIALHDQNTEPDPQRIIHQFVEGALARSAASGRDNPATEYRQALRALAGEMLTNRQIEFSWSKVSGWTALKGEPLRLISRLAHDGELIRLIGPSENQRLLFRHDRVRDWVLTDAASELDNKGLLTNDIISEPYFAEIVGAAIFLGQPQQSLLERIVTSNPLALFHAFRLCGEKKTPHSEAVLQKIKDWLDNPATHEEANLHLRWEALAMLAETDSVEVPALTRKFRDFNMDAQFARLRNGDLSGGIALCFNMEPGIGYPGRDIQIEHAKIKYGQKLANSLGVLLKQKDLKSSIKIGALRLAGHIADPDLSLSIKECWDADAERNNHLTDYLWALAQCCAKDPARFLDPVCDAWATLSDQPVRKGSSSPRDDVAGDGLQWAFRKWPPHAAIDYFIKRASQDELKWPILYMLHSVDHPAAIRYVVKELATIRKRIEGTRSFSPFLDHANRDWQQAQENGRPMSKISRDLLFELWKDKTNDKHIRFQAFSFWSATQDFGDIQKLRDTESSDELADNILCERLVRGDRLAIPLLIEKLSVSETGYWWQFGRYIWSQELTNALDNFLERRGSKAKRTWNESLESDWITYEMIMRLPETDAERLLLKHWEHLRFSPYFIQTALFLSSPSLLAAVKDAIIECPEPAKLMKYLSQHFGLRRKGRAGITRESQMRALASCLHLLSPLDVYSFWEVCNERGWFTMRQELFDELLHPQYQYRKWGRDNAFSTLDKMIAGQHPIMIDHFIDNFMRTGITWNEILTTIVSWLEERQSIDALKIVAAAIEYRGTRKDIGALKVYAGIPETKAKQLIADVQFAVRRKTLQ